MSTIGEVAADAIRDQLVDARCALRDGLTDYAMECIRRAEALAKLPPGARYADIRPILDGKP